MATEVIDEAKATKTINIPFFRGDFLATIIQIVRSELRKVVRPKQVVRADRKIGRNETVKVRYEDGRVAKGKYKGLAQDIEAGKCELVLPDATV
jgi:hypothetical protein